ncbi:sialic acid-binding Ig-like lectin 10 isoform X2 [Mustelus asterias]
MSLPVLSCHVCTCPIKGEIFRMSTTHWTRVLIAVCLIQSSMATSGWGVTVPPTLPALQGTLVTFNCSFKYPYDENIPADNITAKWLKCPCDHPSAELYNSKTPNPKPGVSLIGDLSQKNCSLQISNIQTNHTGEYRFRFEIKDKDKWTGKHALALTVHARPGKPNITWCTELLEGVNSTLICSSSDVDEKAQITLNWYGIGDLAAGQCSVSNSKRTLQSCRSFIPSYQHHKTIVKCFVNYSKFAYSDEGNITLDVKYAPKNITIQVVNGSLLEIKEGDAVSLKCTGNSNPEATYTWYKKEDDKGHTESQNSTRGILSFHNISRSDSGFYNCTATNRIGHVNSEALEISVQYKPYEININQSGMSFICVAKTNPLAEITWIYPGNVKPVINGKFTNSTLTLQTTLGICVSCQARNKHGVIYSEQRCLKSTQLPASFLPLVIAGSIVGAILLLAIGLWTQRKYLCRGKKPEIQSQPVFHSEMQDPKQDNQESISVTNRVYDNLCMSESPAEKMDAPRGDSAGALVYASIQFGKKPEGLNPENPNAEQMICSGIQDDQVAEYTVYENVDRCKTSSEEASVIKKDSEDAIMYACVVFKNNPHNQRSTKHREL